MIYALYRQWRRSSWIGFLKRLYSYVFGQECYSCEFRMRLVEQFRVGDCMREQWRCKECGAGLGEIY